MITYMIIISYLILSDRYSTQIR